MPELPNIVQDRLRAMQPVSAHPDADVLTAFGERALPERERAVVMEHLARCHDCRDVLALALPVSEATVCLPLPERGSWLRVPMLRWGVVAAGCAVLAVTGMLVYQRRHRPESYIAAKMASVPLTEPASIGASQVVAKPAPGTPMGASGTGASYGDPGASHIKDLPPDAAHGQFRLDQEKVVASETPALSAPNDASSPRLTAPQPSAGAAAQGGAIGGVIKPSSQAFPQAARPTAVNVEVAQAAPLAPAASADLAAKSAQLEARAQAPDRLRASAGQPAFFDAPVDKAKAPSATAGRSAGGPIQSDALVSAPRWAIGTTGSLLRSFDQGTTWASVDVAAQAGSAGLEKQVAQNQKYQQATQNVRQLPAAGQIQSQTATRSQMASPQVVAGQQRTAEVSVPVFRALSAAGAEVWAGGTAGMLYHSADGGQQWTRVFLVASGIPSTGDITGIAFPDPRHGQITTSTGEMWTTLDAGQTWQKR